MKFEGPTALAMKISILCYMTPCNLVSYPSCTSPCVNPFFFYPEYGTTFLQNIDRFYHTTEHHITKDSNLEDRKGTLLLRSHNLKCYIWFSVICSHSSWTDSNAKYEGLFCRTNSSLLWAGSQNVLIRVLSIPASWYRGLILRLGLQMCCSVWEYCFPQLLQVNIGVVP